VSSRVLDRFEESAIVVGALKIEEYRREARRCKMVEADQFFHHSLADQSARHFFFAEFLHVSLNAIDELIERRRADRSLLAGFLHGRQQLLALVILASLVALDDLWKDFFDALTRGESALTLEALSAAADLVTVSTQARVDHPVC
jgi:hypothetical protein